MERGSKIGSGHFFEVYSNPEYGAVCTFDWDGMLFPRVGFSLAQMAEAGIELGDHFLAIPVEDDRRFLLSKNNPSGITFPGEKGLYGALAFTQYELDMKELGELWEQVQGGRRGICQAS